MAEQEIINLGIVGIKNCGEYNSQTQYEKLNVVTYQGSSYCALRNTNGNLPTDTNYWQLYAEKGEQGVQGEQGDKPVKGVDYFTTSDKEEIENDLSTTIHAEISEQLGDLVSATPLAVSSVSGMTDTSRIYVNTSDGNWYYYSGSAWVIGGVYQSSGIADGSITINKLSSELSNKYLTDFDWVVGSVKSATGALDNQTNRIRFYKKQWLKKGTIIKFTQNLDDADLVDWSFQSWETTDNLPIIENSGWETDDTFTLEYDAYYVFVLRYRDNRTLETTDIPSLANTIKILPTISNKAGNLTNWYSTSNPFTIEERYYSNNNYNNIHITCNSGFWLAFNSMREFYNNSTWATVYKINSKIMTFNLGEYGTSEIVNSINHFDIVIPNNYALVINTITGVVSVKQYGAIEETDGLLVRNAHGYGVIGAIRTIYDFWEGNSYKNKINALENAVSSLEQDVDVLETNAAIDYDFNVNNVAHRGYSTIAPENTLPAYKLAKQRGFKYAECDISFTSDNVPVLLHDSTIDRTSDGTGNINNLTYEQVSQYDFGSWKSSVYAGTKIPTFEEFILLCKNIGLQPYIELKDTATYTATQIQGLVDTVKRYGMDGKVTWISFSLTYLGYVKNYDSKARLGYVVNSITDTVISQTLDLKTTGNEVFIDCKASNANQTSVNKCINNNIMLEVWTINEAQYIISMNPYITGVTSNDLLAGKILYDYNIN